MPIKFHPSDRAGKSPTVFILHGMNGPDARGEYWAKFFQQRGYNAFQPDFKTGRFTGPSDRMALIPSSLVDHAVNWLTQQPTVDASSLVWMGLSFGGSVGLMQDQTRWASFIIFYPGCWNFTKDQSPKPPHYWAFHAEVPRAKPTLVVWGADDDYGEGRFCPEMVKLMSGPVETLAIPGAHHGFDGEVRVHFRDYVSPTGWASLRPSANARQLATSRVSQFLNLTSP